MVTPKSVRKKRHMKGGWTPELYREWMDARVVVLRAELRLSKKRCWQIASREWLEMRRQEERAARARDNGDTHHSRAEPVKRSTTLYP
jgi:hypothetical protein